LTHRCEAISSLLCVGLDPRIAPDTQDVVGAILRQNLRIIEATADFAAAFKPNSAFYERFGAAGFEALEGTIRSIPNEIPIILDVKRADLGATSEAYADAAFRHFGVDAVTLNPYLGREALEPFLSARGKGVFIVCRTSNAGAELFQMIPPGVDGDPLYVTVARACSEWGANVGLVVAANDPTALRRVREIAPNSWILAPGIGVQGGDAGIAVQSGLRADGLGMLVHSSRGIAEADDPLEAARTLRDLIEAARGEVVGGNHGAQSQVGLAESRSASSGATSDSGNLSLRTRFHERLVTVGAFRTGEYTLKSGLVSPFYLDMRMVPSDPELLSMAGEAYSELLAELRYDVVAAIPTAGLPLGAAACLATGSPMIYPRLEAKRHGTGNRIEGIWVPGQRVVLLDDVITTGASKLEAATILREAGLVVTDLVVLVERGATGRRELLEAGITVHSYTGVAPLIGKAHAMGEIDATTRDKLIEFAGGDS